MKSTSFFLFLPKFQRLILLLSLFVDIHSVFVYTLFIYLYAVMFCYAENSKIPSHFHKYYVFPFCFIFFIGQHSGMSVLTS
jgi:hypothetical protein